MSKLKLMNYIYKVNLSTLCNHEVDISFRSYVEVVYIFTKMIVMLKWKRGYFVSYHVGLISNTEFS